MNATNFYDMIKTVQRPSLSFIQRRKQAILNRLAREILMKEYQFRSCRTLDEDIQKRIYEKELGELYRQLMEPFRDALNTPEISTEML